VPAVRAGDVDGVRGGPFRRFWSSAATSNLADGVGLVAWPWLASSVTRDPLALSAVALVAGLPWLLVSLPAGVWIDRVDRGRLIAACDAGRAVLLLAVGGTVLLLGGALVAPDPAGSGPFAAPPHALWWLAGILLAAFVLGCLEVFRDSAGQAFVPELLPPGDLERGNGRLGATEMVANALAGPPLGGLLVAAGLAVPFLGNAAAYAVAGVLVLSIGARPRPTAGTGAGRPPFRAAMAQGLRWLRAHRLLWRLAIVLGLCNFASMCATATQVLFAQEVLGTTSREFGLMLTGAALGGVLGGLSASRLSAAIGPGRVIAGTLLVQATVLLLIAAADRWQVVWLLLAVQMFTVLAWNVVTVSLRQRLVPSPLFGRVNSVYRFLGWGAIPLGALLGGAVVAATEPLLGREGALRAPFVVGALLSLVALALAVRPLSNRRIAEAG
jgi:MFS family permease